MVDISEERYELIPINFLEENSLTKEDLYLDTGIVEDNKKKFQLYLRKNEKFTYSKREYLLKKNIDKLFIKKKGDIQFPSLEEFDLGIVIDDDSIPTREKMEMTRNVAKSLVNNILNALELTKEGASKIKSWAKNTIDLIMQTYQGLQYFLLMDISILQDKMGCTLSKIFRQP